MIMFTEVPCIKGELDSFHSDMHPVVEEIPLAVTVNGLQKYFAQHKWLVM